MTKRHDHDELRRPSQPLSEFDYYPYYPASFSTNHNDLQQRRPLLEDMDPYDNPQKPSQQAYHQLPQHQAYQPSDYDDDPFQPQHAQLGVVQRPSLKVIDEGDGMHQPNVRIVGPPGVLVSDGGHRGQLEQPQQQGKGVSFANGEQGQIPQATTTTPSISDRRRLSLSISAQPTLAGKIGAVWRNIYTKLGLRQWSILIVMVCYAVLGGLMFSWLEKGHTRKTNQNLVQSLTEERENLTNDIFRIMNEPWLYPDYVSQRAAIADRLRIYQYDRGLGPKSKPVWDLWDGVFFAFTVFTTIGYGHYTPVTKPGRIATIIYALVGIPLLLAILADFGRVLTRVLKRMWSFVRTRIKRVLAMRRFKKFQEAAQKAGLDLEEEGGLDGIAAEDEEFNFPIPLAVFLIVSWLFICASFFLLWETSWTYFEAFYFFFISLSTIGLGDVVPEHQKYMMLGFPFVLIGLSLVTLVINLIQNKIEEMKERAQNMLDDQMGVEGEEEEYDGEDEETEIDSDIEQTGEVHFPRPGDSDGEASSTVPTTPRPRRKPKEQRFNVGMIQTTAKRATPQKRTPKAKGTTPAGAGAGAGAKKPKKEGRTNLGLIQTFKLPKNRRKIATQTDDSYVRDVIHREGRRGLMVRSGSDRFSVITGNSEYFDAE